MVSSEERAGELFWGCRTQSIDRGRCVSSSKLMIRHVGAQLKDPGLEPCIFRLR